MSNVNHTDIRQTGWVEGIFPAPLKPYAYLARLDRPIGIWLLLLPGWWAIMLASGGITFMNARDWWLFFLFAVGAVLMRAAGCVINDIWDRKLDARVERTALRPLASGVLSLRQALVFLALLLAGGLIILLQMNIITILLGILSLPLIILYPLMKRWTWWPQAFLGITFNFGALMGWSAVSGVLDMPALLLYAGGVLWTLGYDTVYAHQDREDDSLIGIKSTALKFGAASKKWVSGFYSLAWVCFAWAGVMAAPGGYVPHFLIPAAAYIFMKIRKWNPDDPADSLAVFKSNKNFALLVLMAYALSAF